MRSVVEDVNALGTFDAIIHNAAVGYTEPRRVETEDGFAHVFAVNSLAPYVLRRQVRRVCGMITAFAPPAWQKGGVQCLVQGGVFTDCAQSVIGTWFAVHVSYFLLV
jgi:NAD(P)-dependent dehydrogenase (short-subunit alcohol dehydrogenase family)